MLNLIKYEMLKKYKFLFMMIAIIFGLQMWIMSTDDTTKIVFIHFLMGVFGIGYLFIGGIEIFRSDVIKNEGWMLFLTPTSIYKIIGVKLIISFIEYCVGFFIYLSIIIFNFNRLSENVEVIRMFNISISGENFWILFKSLSFIMLTWFILMVTIYLAIVIHRSVLSNKKFSGIITFIIVILLNIIISKILHLITNIFKIGSYDNIILFSQLIIATLLFLATGYLLKNKANLN